MNSMQLQRNYELTILGKRLRDLTVGEEWNGFIELIGGPNQGKIIVRRKDWTNGKRWAKEENAFIAQEIEVFYADSRFGLPKTEVVFVKPEGAGT